MNRKRKNLRDERYAMLRTPEKQHPAIILILSPQAKEQRCNSLHLIMMLHTIKNLGRGKRKRSIPLREPIREAPMLEACRP